MVIEACCLCEGRQFQPVQGKPLIYKGLKRFHFYATVIQVCHSTYVTVQVHAKVIGQVRKYNVGAWQHKKFSIKQQNLPNMTLQLEVFLTCFFFLMKKNKNPVK